MILERVCECLDKHQIAYAIVGGYAVALHGAPRGTFDIDLIISLSEENFIAIEKAFATIDLESRLPVSAKELFNFRTEYIQNKNLIAWSFINPNNPFELVDIVITENLDNYHSIQKQLRSCQAKVLSKKDLIKMKTKSGRAQDLEDVRALKAI